MKGEIFRLGIKVCTTGSQVGGTHTLHIICFIQRLCRITVGTNHVYFRTETSCFSVEHYSEKYNFRPVELPLHSYKVMYVTYIFLG
jgi:hypothetical protein